MAKIRYTGPITPMSIPGVGPVGEAFVPCPADIAAGFKDERDFEVQLDPPAGAKKTGGAK